MLDRETIECMLSVQSKAFKDCLDIFVSRFDHQAEKLLRQVTGLERNVEFKDSIYDDLLQRLDKLEKSLIDERQANDKRMDEMQEKLDKLTTEKNELEDRLNYIDDQGRRNNIRIHNLPEDENET